MLDLIRKSLDAAIGGISNTQEKMQELADELVVKGHLTKKEAADLLKDLKGTVKESQKKVSSLVEDQVRKAMKDIGLATHSEIKALTGRIDKLEKELAKERKKGASKKAVKVKVKKEKKLD